MLGCENVIAEFKECTGMISDSVDETVCSDS